MAVGQQSLRQHMYGRFVAAAAAAALAVVQAAAVADLVHSREVHTNSELQLLITGLAGAQGTAATAPALKAHMQGHYTAKSISRSTGQADTVCSLKENTVHLRLLAHLVPQAVGHTLV
jgi:hypothetical protein